MLSPDFEAPKTRVRRKNLRIAMVLAVGILLGLVGSATILPRVAPSETPVPSAALPTPAVSPVRPTEAIPSRIPARTPTPAPTAPVQQCVTVGDTVSCH